jgi:hypothetical protein
VSPGAGGRPGGERGGGALGEIFRFEVRYHLRQPLFWIVAVVFGLLTFGATTSDAVTIGGGIGNVHRNAPVVILTMLGVMSVLGIFVVTAFVASAVHRDFEHGTAELFFSKPIRRRDYLLGRFAGSILVSFLIFLGPALGILIGTFMPWLEPERLGGLRAAPYLFALLVVVLPNLLFAGALFFGLASLTRSTLSTYLGVVGFLALYFVAGELTDDLENRAIGALIDPFGLSAVELATRYWTVVERNARVPPLLGPLLWNRLLWTAVGLLALAATVAVFRTSREGLTRRQRRRRRAVEAVEAGALAAVAAPVRGAFALPRVARRFDSATAWRQLAHEARLETVNVLRSVPFLVLFFFGMFNVVGGSGFLDDLYGTKVYPVTALMLQLLAGSFFFLLMVIVIFYAGELVWRERTLRLSEVHDAMPTPNWVPLGAKLTALAAVVVVFVAGGGLTTVGIQLWRRYTDLEPGLYLGGLALAATPFLLAAALAVFLQVVANNKFLGYLLMILWLGSAVVLEALDFDHNLYRFGDRPSAPYSDMNGYGHFLEAVGWFTLYWALAAVALVVLSHLLWVRGTGLSWRDRLRLARQRLGGGARWALAAAVLGFAATGGWIFYNTNVLNEYVPGDEAERRQAEYEKKYRRHLQLPLPRIVAVDAEVDIFPRRRAADVRARWQLVNRTGRAIETLHLSRDPRHDIVGMEMPPHRVVSDDRELGYTIYRLARPLAPGERLTLGFRVRVDNPGFVNHGSDTSVVYNGTFFNNRQVLPTLGYDPTRELEDRNTRREHGLPPVVRMPRIDDVAEHQNTYLARDSDWIRFACTVSTDADQIALAPGYLEREWTAGGRRYYRYAMDAPILHFYSFLSARWAVARDAWTAPDGRRVAIEIYHLPEHHENVPRMIDGVKKSLAYFTAHFSPYQHRQVRILEFPRYARFAQSFPNTIPYSESIGFIADLRDPEDIDYVFYVTAHEVAHQWWAHQVIGANVQGSTVLSETLSQYSALMVMEQEYGPAAMRKFLEYELDSYLRNRGGELVEELPLYLVENQPYIHYRKGSLVMYALRDAIGEEAVNRALRRLIADHAFEPAPFPDSRALVAAIRAETPPDQQRLVTDLFEKITVFENRAVEAAAARRPDGRWAVELTLAARKAYADGQGRETTAPLDEWIDVGVLGPKPEEKGKPAPVLYLRKHRITSPETRLQVVVDAQPAEAGIDPFNKLVDRNSDDNRRKVRIEG